MAVYRENNTVCIIYFNCLLTICILYNICEKDNLKHARTCMYNINYHIAWSIKYRREMYEKIDGYYYYKEGESFLCETIKQINGDWYAFNTRGRMITGFTHTQDDIHDYYESNVYYEDCGKYYYGSYGRRCYYTGWQMLEGNWYYFNNYSEAASGWKMINCVKYYFDTEDHYNDSAQKPPAVRKNVRGMNAPITNNATIIPTGFSSGIVGFSWPDVLQNAVIRCIALLFQEKHFR